MSYCEDSIKKEERINYNQCIGDLINSEIVQSMKQYIQHGDVTCLDHCKNVSYKSYKICKFLNLDYKSAARGALLHDFFLYDWHIPDSHVGLHGFRHSKISLKNAEKYFELNNKEKDIILSHMWPLTLKPPKYKESFVVTLVDKFCSSKEIVTHICKKYIINPFNMKNDKIQEKYKE
jgi:uncharacterized protein